ncbi:alanine--tRNA ligase [Bdellovibrionota bacterium FG-2]
MKASEIRSSFLKYFEKNGHTVIESSALVPQNDPTLLFTNAGMVQFKDVFLGNDRRAYTRATSSQKCVRAGGKHNDLENVGFTARHHTFFEMLGNFSFGDYFKKEAIHYAWEFVTEVLKLPKDRLFVTVYEKDDEAADIWHDQEKVPRDRIYRFGDKDNFWSMGETGPCGPCSEIFIDRGAKYSCGKPTCAMGCDCDRYMEFWNLVFMQFNRDVAGKLTPLPKPSVDTGAGLERIASILQDVETNYDTDLFQHIIGKTAELARLKYDPKSDTAVSFRVIADHSRATTFLISDGVMPSNEGRGYVLRRIIRRAIRHGKKLGFEGPFLNKTAGFVIDQMKEAYPDLIDKRTFIEKAILAEEEQFLRTLERGLILLDEETAIMGSTKVVTGEVAFKLYDTYGFPLDLTRVICAEKGLSIDEAGFEKCMERQRSESRKHWKGSGEEAVASEYIKLTSTLKAAGHLPQFVGYEASSAQAKCLGIFTHANDDIIEAVFSVTPFYGESGGQTGDRGRIVGTGGATFEGEVLDTQKPTPELIVVHIKPLKGTLVVDETYLQETDTHNRGLIERNHSGTHLLHWALREVLGKHVKQAGSLVTPELLRFDFAHFQPMTDDEVLKVEDLINEKIWSNRPVSKREMDKDSAIAAGAIAFFGEKYGDKVRVVKVGDFSTELCGGTHVNNSAEISLFKIANESGIAAGVRRIIAYTSQGAFNYLRKKDEEVKIIRDRLKASSSDEILGKIDRLFATERELRKQVEQAQAKSAGGEVDEFLAKAIKVGDATIVVGVCATNSEGIKRLRDIADKLKQKSPGVIAVLGMIEDGGQKVSIIAALGPQAPKKVGAGDIIKEVAPLIDGRGGGKPDFAQAGGTKISGLAQAIEAASSMIQRAFK